MKTARYKRWSEAGIYEAPGVCRWCGCRVPRPRRFCDDPQCRIEVRIRAEPRFARKMVGKRDKGVCAICGCDTLKLYRILRHVHRTGGDATAVANDLDFTCGWQRAGVRWQADHITPVVEGGGGCGLTNLRTLCTPCHRAVTTELVRRRALRRKSLSTAPDGALESV